MEDVSDYRAKENIVALTNAITRLEQIPVYRFNFKVVPEETVDGFLAHEVRTIVPEAVPRAMDMVDSEGQEVLQYIRKDRLVPLLFAALQEEITERKALAARVIELELLGGIL